MDREHLVDAIVEKMFNNASIEELKDIYTGYQKNSLLCYTDEQVKELADEYLIDTN